MSESGFELVEKEIISNYHFPSSEVLEIEKDRNLRKSELARAIALGNLEHLKVKIYFADEDGKKVVHTTIWAITEVAILLKKNVVIPIQRIYKLEI
jgi:hypothetical protein